MIITKHAQSCFLIEINQKKILIDPGNFVFNEEGLKPDDFINIDLMIFTHEHPDHFDWENVEKIIKKDSPIILGTKNVLGVIQTKYLKIECRLLNAGSMNKFNDFTIEGTVSKHGPLPNGNTPPNVCGAVINDGRNKFYTPGDSIFLDEKSKANIVAIPICGQVVMNIEQAKEELLKIKPQLAIPIHYDSPRFPADVNEFVKEMKNTGIEIKVLSWGESIC